MIKCISVGHYQGHLWTYYRKVIERNLNEDYFSSSSYNRKMNEGSETYMPLMEGRQIRSDTVRYFFPTIMLSHSHIHQAIELQAYHCPTFRGGVDGQPDVSRLGTKAMYWSNTYLDHLVVYTPGMRRLLIHHTPDPFMMWSWPLRSIKRHIHVVYFQWESLRVCNLYYMKLTCRSLSQLTCVLFLIVWQTIQGAYLEERKKNRQRNNIHHFALWEVVTRSYSHFFTKILG